MPIGPNCANSRAASTADAARYLLGNLPPGDYLSECQAQFGYSCEEMADEHLTT